MPTTARLGLPYPVLAGAADVPADILALATALDAVVDYRQTTAASRPAAPTHQAMLHWSTDTHRLSYWDGSAWWDIGPTALGNDTITTAMLQALAVTQAKIADGAVSTSKVAALAITNALLASSSVDATKVANSLKPSAGAGGATEALRALGTTPGTALAGDAAVATPVTAVSGLSKSNGQTYTITAPATGTYILEYGIASYSNSGQGQNCTVTPSTGGPVVNYGDVGAGGGVGVQSGLALTAGQVVTLTMGGTYGGGNLALGCFAKLTRVA